MIYEPGIPFLTNKSNGTTLRVVASYSSYMPWWVLQLQHSALQARITNHIPQAFWARREDRLIAAALL